jgi:hypothetical protein
LPPLATLTHKKTRGDKVEQCAVDGIDRDHPMQGQAATIPTGANTGRVLDGEHMTANHTRPRAHRRRRHHLGHTHRRIVQKPKQPDLTRPILAEPANPYPAPASLDRTPVQKVPLFPAGGRQNSPASC